MQTITEPDVFRSNISKKLEEILESDTLAINVEKSVFNYTIQESSARKIVKKWDNPYFVQIYIDRMRSIYINLKNEEFKQQIKTGEITPQQLSSMTHQEMNPQRWKEYIERKIKKDNSRLNTNVEASTDMFTCKKCKSKRCTYYELQTRSADEPMTIFVTCLDCGKNFKC
jgi:transcription elongation factor S-II